MISALFLLGALTAFAAAAYFLVTARSGSFETDQKLEKLVRSSRENNLVHPATLRKI